MTAPDEGTIRKILERSFELWNAGDRDGYLALAEEMAPGGFSIEDPVGTPPITTMDGLAELLDRTRGWTLSTDRVLVCGSSAAMVTRAEGEVDGATVTVTSIDTYDFADDGSLVMRSFYEAAGP